MPAYSSVWVQQDILRVPVTVTPITQRHVRQYVSGRCTRCAATAAAHLIPLACECITVVQQEVAPMHIDDTTHPEVLGPEYMVEVSQSHASSSTGSKHRVWQAPDAAPQTFFANHVP